MSLKNCKRCGKLFDFQGYNVCPECAEKDADDFKKIWDYLSKHPSTSILELSRKTGVKAGVINRFRREGRLVVDKKKDGEYFCQSCGALISEGQLCQECANQLRSKKTKAEKKSSIYKRR